MNDSGMGLAKSLALGAVMAAVACAPSSTASSAGQTPSDRRTAAVTPSRPIPSVCDSKIVAPDDLASVLRGTITAKTLAGDPQTCKFSAEALSSVSVTVRPGLGDVTVSDWTGGKAAIDAAIIDGIGDRAVWESTLHELIATRHNVLCDIGSQGATGSQADLQKTFAQLCDKIWAAQ
jgi:hypothetical protein